jgi:hypothetical protein
VSVTLQDYSYANLIFLEALLAAHPDVKQGYLKLEILGKWL